MVAPQQQITVNGSLINDDEGGSWTIQQTYTANAASFPMVGPLGQVVVSAPSPLHTITPRVQSASTATATLLPQIPRFNLTGALSFALNVGGQYLAVRIGQGPMAAQYGNAGSRLVQTFAPNIYISPPMAEFEPWWEALPQAPYGPDFSPGISYGH